MKRCPECRRDYYDESLIFCLDDGERLVEGPARPDDLTAARTVNLPGEAPTRTYAADEKTWAQVAPNRKSVVVGVVLITVLSVGGYWYLGSNARRIDSIAVMPFENASNNPELDYMSDGMTDTLIGSLSQLQNLKVKARAIVFRYKGKEAEVRQIASDLNVQAVLTGRVVQQGEDLTLFLSLVDAASENNLWSKRYQRKVANLAALQTEIARDVSENLRTRISGTEQQSISKGETDSTEAYQLYLRGRYHALKMTPQDGQKAVEYFQKAVEIDPAYAMPYLGLTDAYRSITLVGEAPPTEFLPKAKVAALRAREINDSLAAAHTALGDVLFWNDWDWTGSERHFVKALELDPNDVEARTGYGHLLSVLGRHEESLAQMRQAVAIDPLNLRTSFLEASFLNNAGRSDESLAKLTKLIELEPNYFPAYLQAAATYLRKGMNAEAIVYAQKARALNKNHSLAIAYTGVAFARLGRVSEARTVLAELLEASKLRYVSSANIAAVYNALGDRENALRRLEQAYNERDTRMVFLKATTLWDTLRDEPRFQNIKGRLNFPD